MISNFLEEGADPTGAQADAVATSPVDETTQRLLSLDVLRGLAVLGGLVVSIWIFGGFSPNQQTNLLIHSSGGNYRLFATVSLLLQGKMMALISLIFGAGMVLYMEKQKRNNLAMAHDYFVRRLLWLMGFGILNAIIFLWPNDLLFQLGVTGILLIPFLHLSPKNLVIAASLFTLVFMGKQYWNYSDDRKNLQKYEAVMVVEKKIKQDSTNLAKKDSIAKAKNLNTSANSKDSLAKTNGAIATRLIAKDTAGNKIKKDSLTKEQTKDKEAWEGLLKEMKYDSAKDKGRINAIQNTNYGDVWNHLLPMAQGREASWLYRIGIWELSMMMMIGMALLKLGFFNHRYSSGRYLLIAVAGLGIGLLLGWYRLYFNNATLLDYTKYIKGHFLPYNIFVPLERSLMAIGYSALVMALLNSKKPGWLGNILADTGRLALTNYLAQSIFCTLFFTGIGLNNYGRLQQWELYLVVAEIWLLQIVFSVIWLRHFSQGPAEWLWHSLVKMQWQPIKKQPSISAVDAVTVKS